jgi:hypothetical protein
MDKTEDPGSECFKKSSYLENHLGKSLNHLGICGKSEINSRKLLELLECSPQNYSHSIVVSFILNNITECFNLDYSKELFCSGLLHDIGKKELISSGIVSKKDFNEEDMILMEKHSFYSYITLKKDFPFEAEVALRHHRHQENSYPKDISFSNLNGLGKTVDFYSKLVAIVDHYQAATARENFFHKKGFRLDGIILKHAESIDYLKKEFPKNKNLIEYLDKKGVFEV